MALLDAYLVGPDTPWGDRQVGHLYRRAAFGATPETRESAVGAGDQTSFEAAVDALVDYQDQDPYLDLGAGSGQGLPGDPLDELPNDDSDLGRVKKPLRTRDAKGRWLYRMRYSSQPFQEMFALFMHDHLVSDFPKVSSEVTSSMNRGNDGSQDNQRCEDGSLAPDDQRKNQVLIRLLQEQIDLFRSQGIDDFRELLLSVTRNPAMLLYLDNAENRLGKAQENFAREVMELFSMGVGNYSEADIQEIAKCLTGETLPLFECESDWQTDYGFNPEMHEPGDKFVFGFTVSEDMTGQETIDVVDLILSRVSVNPDVSGFSAPYDTLPATAVYLSWKLLTWFVSHEIKLLPTPDPVVLELADYMVGSDGTDYPNRRYPYDLRACVRKILTSQFFYDESNVYSMYKTPVDYVVMALRVLDAHEDYTSGSGPARAVEEMGMDIYEPPNVAGWDHGTAWITSGNLIERYNYANRVAERLFGGNDGNAYIESLLAENGGPFANSEDHATMIAYYADRLIQDELTADEEATLYAFLEDMPGSNSTLFRNKIRGLMHVMMTMPIFQLK
jgi:hypothetical protein